MRNRLDYIPITTNSKKRTYKKILYPSVPLSVNDIYVITVSGDRLDSLAYQFYKDVRLWWVISIANRDIIKRDSYALDSGLEIRIPANIDSILKSFERINNMKY